MLRHAAQPRAHAHELQLAVNPVRDPYVGEPDLPAYTRKHERTETATRVRKEICCMI